MSLSSSSVEVGTMIARHLGQALARQIGPARIAHQHGDARLRQLLRTRRRPAPPSAVRSTRRRPARDRSRDPCGPPDPPSRPRSATLLSSALSLIASRQSRSISAAATCAAFTLAAAMPESPLAGGEIQHALALHPMRLVDEKARQRLPARPAEGPIRRRHAGIVEFGLRCAPDRRDLGRQMQLQFRHQAGLARSWFACG